MKKAFTLVELMIVIFIMSGLLLGTSMILITIIAQNNQVNIRNDVRNEANIIIGLMVNDIRASRCENVGSNWIDLYSEAGVQNACSGTYFARYRMSGYNLNRNGTTINSGKTWIRYCTGCSLTGCSSGLDITYTPTRTYSITLSLRQAINNPRSDFCGRIQVFQTVKPRNMN
jgi:prepilin-type N-terminal cleavage/methylation domain-containing protein